MSCRRPTAACFTVATVVFLAVDSDDILRLRSPWFWMLVGSTLLGSVEMIPSPSSIGGRSRMEPLR
jgi:hypothetical protein